MKLNYIPHLFLFLYISNTFSQNTNPPVFLDMQGHMAAHLSWKMLYKPAPDAVRDTSKKLTYKHAYTQVVHDDFIRKSGVQVIFTAAYAKGMQGRKTIVKQLDYIEGFVKKYNAHYALCKTPAEVYEAVNNNKIAIVQSIEGAHKLIKRKEDALFWSSRGVALITPIHLSDQEFGGASILKGWKGLLINQVGILKNIFCPNKRGLSNKGRNAIKWIAEAGIMVDLSHMSKQSSTEAIKILEALKVPPVVTHGHIYSLRLNDAGISDSSLTRIYSLGGILGIGLNYEQTDPHKNFTLPENYCPGTIDGFIIHYNYLTELLRKNGIADNSIAIGWASDWNGFVNHLKPKYGKDGCEDASSYKGIYTDYAVNGITSPASMNEFFGTLKEQNVDMKYMYRASDRFLSIWNKYLLLAESINKKK